MNTTQKIALVTGATRGIGQAIARKLAADNIFVIGTATTEKGADAITGFFKVSNLSGIGKMLNVTDLESAKTLVDELTQQYGAVSVLVNNAGITRDNLMLRMKSEEWYSVMNTNLNAIFYMTQYCLRGMTKARWGRIVNISSVVGSTGNPGQANYCTAKAGMLGFTKALALEMATRGITVNAVSPGFIDTRMTQALNEKQKEAILNMIPMNRMGKPSDIAAVVSFLISDNANYITGQTIHVNGGMFMA